MGRSPRDGPARDADETNDSYRYAISPGYFEAMGIPLRAGRALDSHDIAGAPLAVVINESLARRRLPGVNPIGQRLHVGPNSGPWFTVVGVVGNVTQTSLAVTPSDAVYTTAEQWRFADNARWLVVRAHRDVASLAPAVRRAISAIDKDQPIIRVATMDERVRASAANRRFALLLFEAFGMTALLLAAVGTYSLLSGSVTERTREIGVRSALGASRFNILALVLRQGMTLTGLGIAIGLAGASDHEPRARHAVIRGHPARRGHVRRCRSAVGDRVDDRVWHACLACCARASVGGVAIRVEGGLVALALRFE